MDVVKYSLVFVFTLAFMVAACEYGKPRAAKASAAQYTPVTMVMEDRFPADHRIAFSEPVVCHPRPQYRRDCDCPHYYRTPIRTTVRFFRERQPIRTFFRERQPVRSFFRERQPIRTFFRERQPVRSFFRWIFG